MSGRTKRCKLIVSAGLEHPAMRLGETPAERIGDPAELFPDGDLLHDARVAPAVFDRDVHGAEAVLDRKPLVARLDLGWQAALVELRLHFPGNQLLGGEPRRALAPRLRRLVEWNPQGRLPPSGRRGPLEMPGKRVGQVGQG